MKKVNTVIGLQDQLEIIISRLQTPVNKIDKNKLIEIIVANKKELN